MDNVYIKQDISKFTDHNDFNNVINYSKTKPNTLIVIDFNASWCKPCKSIKPFIQYLEESYPKVEFYDIDIEDEDKTDIISNFKVTKVPTFVYYKNGIVCKSIIGTNKEQIEENVNEFL